jgi:two-component system, chemotaxis family, chemotaxis protein CheY
MTSEQKSISEMNILVVDDHPLTRNLVKSILKSAGYEVTLADNGQEALHVLQLERKFDCVVCDWNMPKMNGLELLSKVRSIEKLADIPFVMLTAEAFKENIVAAVNAGVNDYVSKPFTADVLIKKVIGAINKN